MGKGEQDREEILDTLEMIYTWHAMPGRQCFKRYGDMTIYSKMRDAVRATLKRAGRNHGWETKRVSKSWGLNETRVSAISASSQSQVLGCVLSKIQRDVIISRSPNLLCLSLAVQFGIEGKVCRIAHHVGIL